MYETRVIFNPNNPVKIRTPKLCKVKGGAVGTEMNEQITSIAAFMEHIDILLILSLRFIAMNILHFTYIFCKIYYITGAEHCQPLMVKQG